MIYSIHLSKNESSKDDDSDLPSGGSSEACGSGHKKITMNRCSSHLENQDIATKASINKTKLQPLVDMYRSVFFFASVMGLHVLKRRKDGSYAISTWRVAVMCFFALISLYATVLLTLPMFKYVPFWFKGLFLPYVYASFFCVYSYFQCAFHARYMVGFMEAVKKFSVPVSHATYVVLVWGIAYPVIITSCSVAMLPDRQEVVYGIVITLITCSPAVLDVYMGCIIMGIQKVLLVLHQDVDQQVTWTLKAANQVTERWLEIATILKTSNKMFRVRLHLRLVGLLVQSMSYIFVLWSLEQHTGKCLPVTVVTVLPLIEVLTRFHYMCYIGEQVIQAGEAVLASVRRGSYEAGLGTPPYQVLSLLTSRLEAIPPAIENWGMDSLSAQTFVTLSGVLLTYVVVLLQFCRRSYMDDDYTSDHYMLTAYDQCFVTENHTLL